MVDLNEFDKITSIKISKKNKKPSWFRKLYLKMFKNPEAKMLMSFIAAMHQANATETDINFEGIEYKGKIYNAKYSINAVEAKGVKQA